MGMYFGNVQPRNLMDTLGPALSNAMQMAYARKRQAKQDQEHEDDRATDKQRASAAFALANPGAQLLPTSYKDITPGSLPNPVDGLRITNRVEPTGYVGPQVQQTGPQLEVGQGYVVNKDEQARVLAERLVRTLASTYQTAAAKKAGELAAGGTKQERIIGQDGSVAFYDPTNPQLPAGFRAHVPSASGARLVRQADGTYVWVAPPSGNATTTPTGVQGYTPPQRPTTTGENPKITQSRKDLRTYQSQQVRAEHDVQAARSEQHNLLSNFGSKVAKPLANQRNATDSTNARRYQALDAEAKAAQGQKNTYRQKADSTQRVIEKLGGDISALDPHLTDDDIREAMIQGAQTEDDVRAYAAQKYGLV